MREKGQALWNSNFIKISLSSFFVFLTFYVTATTLPVYVKESLNGSGGQIGLSMTVFIIASVLVRPFAGIWMERFGQRKIVFFSLLLFFVAAVYYLNVFSFVVLLLLRFVHGGSFAIATTSTNAVALKEIPESRKGEGISYFSLFMSLAMVIGPFIGLTVISHFGFHFLFILCGAFALLALVFAVSTRSKVKSTPAPRTAKGPLRWRDLIESSVIPIGLTGFVAAFAYSGLTSFISIYADSLSLGATASYFFVCFGIMIVLPRPFVGKVLDRHGEHVIVYPSIVAFAVGLFLLSQAHTSTLFLVAGAVCGLGYGALLPCFQTIAVKSVAIHRQVQAIATFYVLFDLGYGIGSYLLGEWAAGTGYANMYKISAVITAATALIYYLFHHKRSRGTVPSNVSGA